jgi:uncharacterized membrane protein
MAEVKTVLGVFQDKAQADSAVDALQTHNYKTDELSIIMKDQAHELHDHGDIGGNVASGALSGATTGGVIGGVAGLLIGIGAITLPGIGAVLIAGPIAAALGLTGAAATTVAGAVTGAVAGTLVGGLVSLGATEEDAREYERQIEAGAVLVAVPVHENNENEVRNLLEEHHASSIKTVAKHTV